MKNGEYEYGVDLNGIWSVYRIKTSKLVAQVVDMDSLCAVMRLMEVK